MATLMLTACATQPEPGPARLPTAEAGPEPQALAVLAEWTVDQPAGLGFGFGSIWIPNHHGESITRIDFQSGEISAVIGGIGSLAGDVLVTEDAVWAPAWGGDLARIDPETNQVAATVPGSYADIEFGFGSLWGTSTKDELVRIDPTASEIIATLTFGDGESDCGNSPVITRTAVWVIHCDWNELIKVDPATNEIVSTTRILDIVTQFRPEAAVPAGAGTDFLWVMAPQGLLRLDPETGASLTYLPLKQVQKEGPFIVTEGAIWLGGVNRISRIDVASNRIEAAYSVDSRYVEGIGAGYGSLWIQFYEESLLQQLDLSVGG